MEILIVTVVVCGLIYLGILLSGLLKSHKEMNSVLESAEPGTLPEPPLDRKPQ